MLAGFRPDSVEVDGVKIFLDPKDSMEFSVREFEPGVTQLFKEKVKKGFVVVDVGAHIGYYTLLSAKLVGPEGKVFAFEPSPENAALLRRGVKENGFDVEVIEKAVSDAAGSATLFMSQVSNDNRCYDTGGNRKKISVQTLKLDDFFRGGRVDFIKVDVDGFEFRVLRGAKDILSGAKAPMFVSEFNSHYLEQAGEEPEEYLRYLFNLGFRVYNIGDREGSLLPVTRAEDLPGWNAGKDRSYNLFCVKG